MSLAASGGGVRALRAMAGRMGVALISAFVCVLAWVIALAVSAPNSHAAGRTPVGLPGFTAEEVERIALHGPWPPPPARDPGNALSGRPAAVALGRQLFFEPRVSPAGVACANCHDPARAFADGRARSVGVAEVERNAPSLWNAGHARWQGWDGAADSLWSQSIRPLLDPREMASSAEQVQAAIAADPRLAARWREVFGRDIGAFAPQEALVGAAKALGAYGATLVSPRTPFDAFRDALVRGDRRAAQGYPAAAQRGLRLFVGRGNCHLCHGGPLFSHGEFADIGASFFVRPGVVDPGRQGGIQALRASPYNLLSRWADLVAGEGGHGGQDEATKTRHVEPTHRNFGEFKVPGLRHVALTAPYLHDGQLPTLQAVVRHYSALDVERLHADGEQVLRPLHLTPGEQADLVAFLETLSPARSLPRSLSGSPARPLTGSLPR